MRGMWIDASLGPAFWNDVLRSLWIDWLLALIFFSSLVYGGVGRRFSHRRSAAALSVTLGVALAIGLMVWQQRMGVSIRDLGPLAAALAMLALAAALFHAFKQLGGVWVGGAIAFGVAVLAGSLLGVSYPILQELLHLAAVVAVVVGVGALIHKVPKASTGLDGLASAAPRPAGASAPTRWSEAASNPFGGPSPSIAGKPGAVLPPREPSRVDMSDFEELGHRSDRVHHRLRELYGTSMPPTRDRWRIDQLRRQIENLLPEEGRITQRLSQLRATAQRSRRGDLEAVKALAEEARRLSGPARGRAAKLLQSRYRRMQMELRMEQLDKAGAALERRVSELTVRAHRALEQRRMKALHDLLKEADHRQKQASKLIKQIERTEAHLIREARDAIRRQAVSAG